MLVEQPQLFPDVTKQQRNAISDEGSFALWLENRDKNWAQLSFFSQRFIFHIQQLGFMIQVPTGLGGQCHYHPARDICVDLLVPLLNRMYDELVQSGSEIKFVPALAKKIMTKWNIKPPTGQRPEAKSLCTGNIQKHE